MSNRHSTTKVHVPGSFGKSGFHHEYRIEEVKIKMEPGMEATEAEGLAQTRDFK